jgi:hypothetical protein
MSNDISNAEARSVQTEPEHGQSISAIKTTKLIWLLFAILETLIALRILLKLHEIGNLFLLSNDDLRLDQHRQMKEGSS